MVPSGSNLSCKMEDLPEEGQHEDDEETKGAKDGQGHNLQGLKGKSKAGGLGLCSLIDFLGHRVGLFCS